VLIQLSGPMEKEKHPSIGNISLKDIEKKLIKTFVKESGYGTIAKYALPSGLLKKLIVYARLSHVT
jgi:hypothetical protein